MTPCLTKLKGMDNQGFSLVELMLAVGFTVFMMGGVYGFYNASNQMYATGVTAQNLQNGANGALTTIIEGSYENGNVYRLATAVSFMIPNGVGTALYTCGGAAQIAACNTSNVFGEIYFCQDSPCAYTDATARWYYLNAASSAIIYHHPNGLGATVDQTIFTAPSGSTLSLRFSPAQVGSPVTSSTKVVEIDVDLNQNIAANITNQRYINSGDTSTFVLLRNHS